MFTLKLLRKIGKILRGGATTREITLGFMLGMMWGFIPGFNLSQFIMLFVVLLLNANFGFMIMGLLFGTLACFGLSSVTFEIGYVLISSLQGLFTSLHNTALVAWMGLDSYCLVGGVSLGTILGLAIGVFLGKTVVSTRERLFKLEGSDKMQELNNKWWVKLLLFVAFGGKLPSKDDQEDKKHPFFRPMGLGLIVFVALVLFVLEMFLLQNIMKSQLEKQLTRANGAEVNINELEFSMSKGTLVMKGIEFTDSSDLTKNAVQIQDIALDVQMSDLLRSRAVVELLKVDTVEFGVLRKSPGKDYQDEDEKSDKDDKAKQEDKEGEFDLNTYLDKAGKYREYYDKLKDYLDKQEQSAEAKAENKPVKVTKADLRLQAEKLGFLNLRASELYQKTAAWHVKKTSVNDIKSDDRAYTLDISDLSSHPVIVGKPVLANLSDGNNIEAKSVLNVHQLNAQNTLTVKVSDLQRKEDIDFGEDTAAILRGGDMNFDLDGTFTAQSLNLPFLLKIRNLNVDVRPGKKVLGLEEQDAEEILNAMESLDVKGEFLGSWDQPKLKIDYELLLKRVQEALLSSGKKLVKKKLDAEKKKAEEKVRKKADEKLDKAKEKLDDKLKGLFGR
ncbi:DUF2062 domain-containing protein [Lentisphaera profundi]|uniref:DUF2062 domain-containing protein n=1 Tax=Lentisphaera profundi TaxID=1658616 RepID=A0ABY7VVX9_9BACT|nr:DUF2062 domain-containing protein [Lentisphaera profundi]WDE98391.1 DUF2062 domain-containing protein [Lentisphaera profundi]